MKSRGEQGAASHRPRNTETVILFVVAGQTFAISTDSVQEIRSTDSLGGSASEIERPEVAKVRHTMERNRRTYYVVNAGVHFGLPVTRPELVLIMRQLRVALLVDRIERMAEIPTVYPLPPAFTGEERCWYRGLTYLDDMVVPVVNFNGFLNAEEFERLDHAANAAAAQRELEGAVQA
jgi:chemotaxis signal transduction protein